MKTPGFTLAAALLLALPATGNAAGNESSGSESRNESPWRLGMALGYGERGNPLIASDDVPVLVDLDIAWFGKRFFFDNGDLGYTFADNERLTGSLMARVRSDQVFFGRTNIRFVNFDVTGQLLPTAAAIEVPDRDYAGEAGIELLADGSWGFLQANAYHDVSGTHDGYEVALEYGVGFRRGNWYIEPGASASYKSAKLNDYYWGVRPEEASQVLPAYEAGDGFNVGAKLRVGYYWSRQWSLQMAVEYERLNDEAAASPIVSRQSVVGYFAGLRFRF